MLLMHEEWNKIFQTVLATMLAKKQINLGQDPIPIFKNYIEKKKGLPRGDFNDCKN